jgi:hypothetical protein
MGGAAMMNLDKLAAQKAQAIIKATEKKAKSDVENVVTKALGVVQEQGVYAGMLYVLSRGSEKKENNERFIAEAVRDKLVDLLNELAFVYGDLKYTDRKEDRQKLLDHFAGKVCAAPIHTLLLVKGLFEQTLMYARYSAKARSDDSGGQDAQEAQK